MKTDYQNINSFDASAIVLAVLGLLLIGTVVFSQLPVTQQSMVIKSFSLLDIHEQAGQELDAMASVMDVASEFENQFYIAFTQVAVIPESAVAPPEFVTNAYNSFLAYSDTVTADYQKQNTASFNRGGEVAGISIDLSIDFFPKYESPPEQLKIPYSYQPPDWGFIEKLQLIVER